MIATTFVGIHTTVVRTPREHRAPTPQQLYELPKAAGGAGAEEEKTDETPSQRGRKHGHVEHPLPLPRGHSHALRCSDAASMGPLPLTYDRGGFRGLGGAGQTSIRAGPASNQGRKGIQSPNRRRRPADAGERPDSRESQYRRRIWAWTGSTSRVSSMTRILHLRVIPTRPPSIVA
jgi:hypothetical protein